jgi:hypothetical protein
MKSGTVMKNVKARLSHEGHLDRLPLSRAPEPASPADRSRTWQLEIEFDFDPDSLGEYWLANCHAFLVDTPSGDCAGVVDDVRLDPITGRTASLEIAAGWFGRHRVTVPAENVRVILPLERRLVADVPRRARTRSAAGAAPGNSPCGGVE